MALTTAAFACFLFTACAAAFLVVCAYAFPTLDVAGMKSGLVARVVIFGVLALWALRSMRRQARADWRPEPGLTPGRMPWKEGRFWLGLGAVTLLPGLVCFACLDAYPWAAPDEIYHLTVARNLAAHGQYASGNPETGFRLFDPYDSVGPPVIVPIAAVFRLTGVSIGAARGVMTGYMVLFLATVYLVFARGRSLGVAAAMSGFAFMSLSSIYLGRTVYGEVPAMVFFLWGLMAWRRGWQADGGALWGLLTGLFLGLAVLCKTILILSAFPVAAVWLSTCLGVRRWRPALLWTPPLGVGAVVGAWWLVQSVFGDSGAASAGDTVGVYQHYLLFGLEPIARNLANFLKHPYMKTVCVFLMLLMGAQAFRKTPSVITAALTTNAFFVLYWWICFTPGQLPRYTWPFYVVAGIFCGAFVAGALGVASKNRRGAWVTAVVVALPFLLWTGGQLREVFTKDEMAAEYALAEYVRALPVDWRLATTYDPVAGTLDLLAGRAVSVVESAEDASDFKVVISRDGTQADPESPYWPYRVAVKLPKEVAAE